jgi:hypothetical protein
MNRRKSREEHEALVREQYRWMVESWNAVKCVAMVQLEKSNDPSCPVCTELAGKRWRLGEQPPLPIQGCTEPGGCCCCYVEFTDRDPESIPFLR